MSLRDDLNTDMKAALKAGDKLKLSTIRMLISAVKNKEIDAKRELADEEVHSVVATLVRQRQDSVEQYTQGGRIELAEKEAAEIEILKAYMPAQMSADEVRAVVDRIIAETGAEGMKDMGRVMKAVMAELKGSADGRVINEAVKAALGA